MAGAPPPGQGGPTPEQIAQMQQAMAAEAQKRGLTLEEFQAQQKAAIEAEAAKAGLSVMEFIQRVRMQAMANQQRQVQMHAQGQAPGHQHENQHQQPQQTQQVPIQPGAPNPQAIALAQWLKGQNIKSRTCILNGQRKEMFKVKRAVRAIDSPAYAKAASAKKSQLPQVTPELPAHEIFKLLPLSLLALRVSKADPHEGHDHAPPKKTKKTKGLWHVKIEQQQEIRPDLHYVFLYEGTQLKQKLYAVGALLLVFAVVLFPLWPITLRIGVWYLSMGMLGLIGLFFAMAIVRLILFLATVFTIPPGLWLYPNLFEDVGFFESFKPVWGWQEDAKAVKAAKKAKRQEKKAKAATADNADGAASAVNGDAGGKANASPTPSAPLTTAVEGASTGDMTQRALKASVEEADDD